MGDESSLEVLLHDLKNPLSQIIGFSYLLEKELKARNDAKLAGHVQRIQQAAEKIEKVLQNTPIVTPAPEVKTLQKNE